MLSHIKISILRFVFAQAYLVLPCPLIDSQDIVEYTDNIVDACADENADVGFFFLWRFTRNVLDLN